MGCGSSSGKTYEVENPPAEEKAAPASPPPPAAQRTSLGSLDIDESDVEESDIAAIRARLS